MKAWKQFLQQRVLLAFLLNVMLVPCLHGGGSGLNTVVIVNQNSSNSCALGNYFCERRAVPAENLLRINWSGSNILWTSNDFATALLAPLTNMLAARSLTNQIDYVVLSMDIPYRTSLSNTVNSTTSALFYGLKAGGGTDPGVTNSYAGSEKVFRSTPPASATGIPFLTTMITAGTLAQAKLLVDHGSESDGLFPPQPVVLAKSSDYARNIRHPFFDHAIFNVNLRGVSSIFRTNTDSFSGSTNLLGFQIGIDQITVPTNSFVRGAIADSMTSWGGVLFGATGQTNLLAFIGAGAAGSYGTVTEPGTDTQKFPDPQVYFYQARGFSLAEAYYQSINAPFLGLTVAEPLSAPFARAGSGSWPTNLINALLTGSAPLSVQFSAASGNRPLQQIDLFVDGNYFKTLTNVAPCAGNILKVVLNGYPITCTVPTNATISSVATALAASLNASAVTNATKVKAILRGDRIELRSLVTTYSLVPFYVADTTPTNTPGLAYTVKYLPDTFPPRMVPAGLNKNGIFQMDLEIPSSLPYVTQASTNLVNWVPIATNYVPGLIEFQDLDSRNYPARFYRLVWPDPTQPPRVSASTHIAGGAFHLQMESAPGQACAILTSTNLVDWTPLWTNAPGGGMTFVDSLSTNSQARFYRAWLVPPAPPTFSVLNSTSGITQIRVDSALRPYTVGIFTNGGQWTALVTNFAIDDIQTSVESSIGSGERLTTFLNASRSKFLPTAAFGLQGYVMPATTPAAGAWLQFTFTKTNWDTVILSVTNQSGTSADMAGQVCALINATPALQSSDGVAAEDFAVDLAGTATFNLRARSPGCHAAAFSVLPKKSTGVLILPSSKVSLMQNLSDLQSRNHLYITAGVGATSLPFTLDTTSLIDGYHELSAVAYEGSHVRTQTRATIPVRVQNSSLTATFTLLDLTNTAPVNGTYHIEVTASTNDVSKVTLFSTGGELAVATNQPTVIFEVQGTNLWTGLHPFYAVVETTPGLKYRTQTRWVRLIE